MSYFFSEDTTRDDLEMLPEFLENFNSALLTYKDMLANPEEFEEDDDKGAWVAEWLDEEWNEDWLALFKNTISQSKTILDEIEKTLNSL
jgi:hypothetical protein